MTKMQHTGAQSSPPTPVSVIGLLVVCSVVIIAVWSPFASKSYPSLQPAKSHGSYKPNDSVVLRAQDASDHPRRAIPADVERRPPHPSNEEAARIGTQGNGAPLGVMLHGFEFSPAGLRFFGIDGPAAIAAKSDIAGFHKSMSEITRSHVRVDASRSDRSRSFFRIDPFWGQAEPEYLALKGRLSKIATKNQNIFAESLGLHNYFGNLGRHEVLLEFDDTEDGLRYRFVESDPDSGKRKVAGTGDFEGFKVRYGNILNVESVPNP